MGKQKYFGKTKNTPEDKKSKPYTTEELDQKIEYAERRIRNLNSRINRISPFLNDAKNELNGFKTTQHLLEDELKQYTGFLAEIRYALRALILQEEDEAKFQSKRICDELSEIQNQINDRIKTIELIEKSIADNKAQIQHHEKEADRWRKKKNDRFPENKTSPSKQESTLDESQPGE